jgi:hypothetical protein
MGPYRGTRCHYILRLCAEAVESPNGAWVEYGVLKPGLDETQRRGSFMIA